MNKKKFLILILITFVSFCLGVSGVKATSIPTCNFNNYGTLEYRTQKDVKWTDAIENGTGPRKTSNNKELSYIDSNGNKVYGWESYSRENREFYYVYAWKGGYIYSAEFTIYTTGGAQCRYAVNVEKYCMEEEGEHCETFKFWFKFNKNLVQNIKFKGTYYDAEKKNVLQFDEQDVSVKKDGSTKYTATQEYEVKNKHIDSGDEKKNQGTGKAGTLKGKEKDIEYVTDKSGNILFQKNEDSCTTVKSFVSKYWSYVMIIAPILLIVLISIDFFKAMASNDADAIKKSVNNTVKRVIAAVILLALPALLSLIFDLFGIEVCI